jgi:hypothetical protein
MDSVAPKEDIPSLQEVLDYAQGNIRKALLEHASHLPPEIQEEAAAEANLKLLEAYSRFQNEGWRSFVYTKCRGAIQDYVKLGRGFKESGKRSRLAAAKAGGKQPRLFERVELLNDERQHDVDLVVGIMGDHRDAEDLDIDPIKWDLVARMAVTDDCIHAMALWLLQFEPLEISKILGVCTARVGQLIRQFREKIEKEVTTDADDPWVCQMIYAFGLAHRFGLPDVDQSVIRGYSVVSTKHGVDLFGCIQKDPRTRASRIVFEKKYAPPEDSQPTLPGFENAG